MKIALAQTNPIIADVAGNRDKIISYIERAREAGVDLVVFPEMSTIGYPPMDLVNNRKLIDDNLESLEKIAAVTSGIGVICGFVDYDRKNPPMLFNSAAFINDGKIISKHHKTLLPQYDVFDELRYFTPAREHKVISFQDVNIGITICEDIWNALDSSEGKLMENVSYPIDPVEVLVGKSVELVVNLSASPFVKGKNKTRTEMLQRTARHHGVGIVYVNQVGGNDSLIFDGNSLVIDKEGSLLCHGDGFTEGLTLVDMKQKNHFRPEYDELEEIRRALVLGIKDYVQKCGFKEVLLGLSGGIDSALTCALAVEALGPEQVIGITMPSMYSSQGSVDDSYELAKNLGIGISTIPIKGLFDEFDSSLEPLLEGPLEGVTEENIQARIRGTLLMALSNKTGRLLLTTGNKSEFAMGYCTLYGDMNGGLAVISDLPKTLVYDLSRHMNKERIIIPVNTIDKPPSAELREDQKDSDSLPPYDILDGILQLYIEEQKSVDEIVTAGYNRELTKSILRTVNLNEYKRRQAAPGLKVTSKAFGTGRRIPIAQRFVP